MLYEPQLSNSVWEFPISHTQWEWESFFPCGIHMGTHMGIPTEIPCGNLYGDPYGNGNSLPTATLLITQSGTIIWVNRICISSFIDLRCEEYARVVHQLSQDCLQKRELVKLYKFCLPELRSLLMKYTTTYFLLIKLTLGFEVVDLTNSTYHKFTKISDIMLSYFDFNGQFGIKAIQKLDWYQIIH